MTKKIKALVGFHHKGERYEAGDTLTGFSQRELVEFVKLGIVAKGAVVLPPEPVDEGEEATNG